MTNVGIVVDCGRENTHINIVLQMFTVVKYCQLILNLGNECKIE